MQPGGAVVTLSPGSTPCLVASYTTRVPPCSRRDPWWNRSGRHHCAQLLRMTQGKSHVQETKSNPRRPHVTRYPCSTDTAPRLFGVLGNFIPGSQGPAW